MAHTNNNDKHKNNEGHGNRNNTNPKEKVAITRVPRGRPLGSKNKPKPPIHVVEHIDNVFKTHVIEFASGVNVAESLLHFSKTHQMGLCVLSATGAVINATLRKTPGSIMLLQGRFDIVSLNGSFLPLGPTPSSWLTVFLASGGGKGGVIGGTVVGPLIASGTVMVIVGAFGSAIYERLPEENGEEEFSGGDSYGPGQKPGGPLNL
ncbi:hypothetical protein Lal_00017525 [Lupinus albus]|uniref:Putative AT-hook motif nuclear-localized protein n=1 Tax=Lupinus albus TaxID=3870 RepID=A0A6A5M9Y7_LUPAL|nr:putative AT-hook motif nuclear-localized protein [Lupinus albus]KAF1869947.1 hypothetical protein Lal_00017525 [Lupinus albus]